MPGRLPSETINILSADPFPQGQMKKYREQFPVGKGGGGEGFYLLRLAFHHTIVIGTGADPRAKGGYNILKNISFRTSKMEEPINCPGMGLYLFNHIFNSIEPFYDPILAADGVYDCILDLPFALPFMGRQEDTIIDTSRYSHLELQIVLGGVADLFGTPGTATNVTTIDISLLRSKTCAAPDGKGKPYFLPYIKHMPPFQALTKGYCDIESSEDLILFGFFAMAHDLATWGTVGTAFTGEPADVLDDITWRNQVMPFVQRQKLGWFKEERAQLANNRTFTGLYPHVFTREGSFLNAFYTGGQSEIKFEIGSVLGTPTTPQVDLVIFGARTLRP
ncbi:hypothetical protein ES703_16574 [subsurface metagenome]